MKTLDRSVKLCLIVHLPAAWTVIYLSELFIDHLYHYIKDYSYDQYYSSYSLTLGDR